MLTEFRVTPSLAWNEAFALWLRRTPTRKARVRSDLTLEAYLRDVHLFAKYFEQVNGQAFTPSLLNTTDLSAYFTALETEGKLSTYNRKLASMRTLIAWARGEGLLDYDPAALIPFAETMRETPRDVEQVEWEKLEQAAESQAHLKQANKLLGLRDLLIFRLLGNAGLRIHEVVGLKLNDLHLADGYIHVLGKGHKHRKVDVGGKLVKTIQDWQAVMPKSLDGTLVTDEKGKAIGRIAAWDRFTMITVAAGVKTTPHGMRHTYIYRFLDKCEKRGMSPQQAMKAVCLQTGDTPEVILSYYTGARESDIRAVAEDM